MYELVFNGKELRDQIIARNISDERFAKAIGEDVRSVANWKNNRNVPNGIALCKICLVLNIPVYQLFSIRKNPEKLVPAKCLNEDKEFNELLNMLPVCGAVVFACETQFDTKMVASEDDDACDGYAASV